MKNASRGITLLLLFAVALLFAGCATSRNSLLQATEKGDIREMERLIAAGAEVNAKDSNGRTPLHTAATYGQKEVAEQLISKGADVNAKDSSGETPLHEAAYRDNKEVAALLISKGADVNAKDSSGETPLHKAAYVGTKEVTELLISKGADVNAKDSSGETPLHMAAFSDQKDIAELLISKGADVNAKDSQGETPLHEAISSRKEIAELLISKGADVNAKDSQGETPLQVANNRGKWGVAELLDAAEEAPFAEVARSYRVATVKPRLPEEAHKFKARAEYALNKKEFEVAVARYKEALDVAPWWPEGHFNRALILGELSRYRDAIREMKKYLMLVPDAPNARTARDNIYGWESELK